MKRGSKYYPLFQHLSTSGHDSVTLSLAEIESLLGSALPESAHKRRDWWGNRNKALQASAWMAAGYKVSGVNLEDESVTFVKPLNRYAVRREGSLVIWDGELIKALRVHKSLNQKHFAEELGVRQQTVSEWETGVYTPSRANCKYLMLVAERAGFSYNENPVD